VLETFRIIRDLNKSGVTILLVEQNARLALKLASYGYVLETGNIRMDSDAEILSKSNSIVEAYLGT
jgi:branched-chain amino acid transport system ATP-binding protein